LAREADFLLAFLERFLVVLLGAAACFLSVGAVFTDFLVFLLLGLLAILFLSAL